MKQLLLQQQTNLSSPLEKELEAFLGRKVLAPARRMGYDLPILGISDGVPERPIQVRTPSGTWAYASDYRSDPAAEQYGGVSPVPGSILEFLEEMYAGGVRPNKLWLAHEVPGIWEPGRPLPPTVPPSQRMRRHDEVLIGVTEQVKRGLVAGAAALGAVAAAPAALLAAAPTIGLDPVILGGVQHPDGPCAWVPLAAWQWD